MYINIYNNLIDINLNLKFNNQVHCYSTRNKDALYLPKVNTNRGKQRLIYSASSDFNNLDKGIRSSKYLPIFKKTF